MEKDSRMSMQCQWNSYLNKPHQHLPICRDNLCLKFTLLQISGTIPNVHLVTTLYNITDCSSKSTRIVETRHESEKTIHNIVFVHELTDSTRKPTSRRWMTTIFPTLVMRSPLDAYIVRSYQLNSKLKHDISKTTCHHLIGWRGNKFPFGYIVLA
jgi:hypothetical protein